MARPVSVTVVLWVIIALTLESLAGLFGPFANSFLAPVAMKHDSSLASTLWSGVAFGIAQILLAFLMLRGIAWARVVYVCLIGMATLALLLKGGFPYISAAFIIKSAILVFILFRAEANQFFAARGSPGNKDAGNPDAA
jgi:hypothetical protein